MFAALKEEKLTMKCAALLFCSFVFQVSASGQQLPKFQVAATDLTAKTATQEEKMRRALAVFEQVMNDECFQKELVTLKFHSDSSDDPYRNLSTRQAVEKIYEAKEHYTLSADNRADIYWAVEKRNRLARLFKGCSVGYGYPKDKEFYTYSCFLDDEGTDLSDIAGHIAHEWSHKLGFVHQLDDHDKRDDTVPYAFGYLVRDHAKKYVGQ
jgi:hypothetical protein